MRSAVRARLRIHQLIGSPRNTNDDENGPTQLIVIANFLQNRALGMDASMIISTSAGARPNRIRCHFHDLPSLQHHCDMYMPQSGLEPKGLQGSHLIKEIQNGLLIHTHSVGTSLFTVLCFNFYILITTSSFAGSSDDGMMTWLTGSGLTFSGVFPRENSGFCLNCRRLSKLDLR